MARVVGWPRKLNVYLSEAQERYKADGFSWPSFNCCTFVADWVLACTRVDPMAAQRGSFSSEAEARALLESLGGLRGALVSAFGEPVHPSKAQRGDIAYRDDLMACGIYFTSGAHKLALFLGESGFSLHKPGETGEAFRVE